LDEVGSGMEGMVWAGELELELELDLGV